MSIAERTRDATRAVRFHGHGEPADVLRLDRTPVPIPGQVRAAVHACGLNLADWALCHGLFAGLLPRGIGLEVSGTVDALGEGVARPGRGGCRRRRGGLTLTLPADG